MSTVVGFQRKSLSLLGQNPPIRWIKLNKSRLVAKDALRLSTKDRKATQENILEFN